jgi:hypothetical protein
VSDVEHAGWAVGGARGTVRADETTDTIRGSRQGASVELDRYATIGATTSSEGTNAISCAHVAFGPVRAQGRLREQRPFVVERGSPGDGLRGLWLLLPGIAVALLTFKIRV